MKDSFVTIVSTFSKVVSAMAEKIDNLSQEVSELNSQLRDVEDNYADFQNHYHPDYDYVKKEFEKVKQELTILKYGGLSALDIAKGYMKDTGMPHVENGGSKVDCIKKVRELTSWGLKQSKDYVEDYIDSYVHAKSNPINHDPFSPV